MPYPPHPEPEESATTCSEDSASTSDSATWVDAAGRAWHVDCGPHEIVLQSNADRLEFPSASWHTDIYVAKHGSGFVIRFCNFEHEVGFLVNAAQAAPMFAQLSGATKRSAAKAGPARNDGAAAGPLLWPKVSPLAVWALICSGLTFLPLVGLLASLATGILLILHRRHIRKARAWSHSRRMCAAALVLMIAGLVVSLTATRWLVHNIRTGHEVADDPYFLSGTAAAPAPSTAHWQVYRGPRPSTASGHAAACTALAQSFWEKEHNWGLITAALVVVLASLTIHECAHAITAWWLGDDFARRLGRVSLSPLAHIDPFGTVLLPLVLLFLDQPVFGWARPVPVRMESVPRWRRAHILVSLAGPGSNLLLASASMVALLATTFIVHMLAPKATIDGLAEFDFTLTVQAHGFLLAPIVGPLCTVLKLSVLVNIFLACFNLIPIPPLDGSWVLEHLFPRTFGPIYARLRPFGLLVFLALIYMKVLLYLLMPAILLVVASLLLLKWCTPF